MDFVTCKLIGPGGFKGLYNYGLANQMFQVAAALSYAENHQIQAVFPMLKEERYGNYITSIFKKLNLENYDESAIELEYEQANFSYNLIPKAKRIRISGYFQSEKYFKDNEKLIREYFKIQENMKIYILTKYEKIIEDSISIHLRFGDYEKIPKHHPVLSKTNYYKNILERNTRKNILVFSDDIEKAMKIKSFRKHNAHFIIGENELVDLYTMSMCNDNAIANSSFSWWGAWLNENIEKKVFFPEMWFGPAKKDYDTKDLFPPTWIKIESNKTKFYNIS